NPMPWSQGERGIPTKKNPHQNAHNHKSRQPQKRVTNGSGSGEVESIHGDVAREVELEHGGALGEETSAQPFKKANPKGPAAGKAVTGERALLECAHDQGGQQYAEE